MALPVLCEGKQVRKQSRCKLKFGAVELAGAWVAGFFDVNEGNLRAASEVRGRLEAGYIDIVGGADLKIAKLESYIRDHCIAKTVPAT